MTPDEVLELFTASGALLDGHFELSSGLHSPGYLQCALVLQHPERAAAAPLVENFFALRVESVLLKETFKEKLDVVGRVTK